MLQGRLKLIWIFAGLIASGGPLRAQDPSPPLGEPVRVTFEVKWGLAESDFQTAAAPDNALLLELSEGARVLEAIAWPPASNTNPRPTDPAAPEASWTIGASPTGRARIRLEGPLSSRLTFRRGPTQILSFPLEALLAEAQRTPAEAPLTLEVARLPWDTIELSVSGDGTATPGSYVPVTVHFNILTPEPTQVELTFRATLRPVRGGDPVWQDERKAVLSTNAVSPPGRILSVPMPKAEGTYTLEVVASWRPTKSDQGGPLPLNWWKRLKRGSPDAATRQVSLAVVAPTPPKPSPSTSPIPSEEVVDAIDLGRPRGLRPLTSGRSPDLGESWPIPDAVLVESQRRDRIWNLIGRVANDFRPLPPKDAQGIGWIAVPVRVPHPGRYHRLDLKVLSGDSSALSVALIAPGPSPRLLLDARGAGPWIQDGGSPITLSWPVWPDTAEPVLLVVNRSTNHALWLGDAQLVEMPGTLPPVSLTEPPSSPRRKAGFRLASPHDFDRFGSAVDGGPADFLGGARNLAAYLEQCAINLAVLPASASDRPARSALDGQAAEDGVGPDRLGLAVRILRRSSVEVLLEADTSGTLEGLPPLADPEAIAKGLALIDSRGQPTGSTYNPLHPEVQQALTRRVLAALDAGGQRPDGLLLRLGPGSTLPGRPDTGLDDSSYERFVKASIGGGRAPGLGKESPRRFAERAKFVSGPGLVPWLAWRAESVANFYAALARAVGETSPGAKLVVATPELDDGPAGEEALRCDRDGLPPHQGWRAVGLDLSKWPTGPNAPLVLRGVSLGTGELEHDLDVHPDLDAQLTPRPSRGTLIGAGGHSLPPTDPLALTAQDAVSGAAAEQPLGHALAALDAHYVIMPFHAMAGQEDRVRRFSRVLRSLPVTSSIPASPIGDRSGTVARAATTAGASYVTLANDTPYPVRLLTILEAPPVGVEDLGRGLRLRHEPAPVGGKRVVLDLEPHGTAVLRVEAPGVRVRSVTPYYDQEPERHRQDVALRLRQLTEAAGLPGLDPEFEGRAEGEATIPVSRVVGPPRGWSLEGHPQARLFLDNQQAHGGQSSLRLDTPEGPASAVSLPFLPPSDAVTLHAWIKTNPPETRVRVRIESIPAPGNSTRPLRLLSDLPARPRPDWSNESLRAAGLPTDGSTPIVLRFELLGPGTLWIDDLSLSAEGQAQARSCLTAALEAFDQGRYADFARLANSHWARRVASTHGLPGSPPVATSSPGSSAVRTGNAATDLPTRPRLR